MLSDHPILIILISVLFVVDLAVLFHFAQFPHEWIQTVCIMMSAAIIILTVILILFVENE